MTLSNTAARRREYPEMGTDTKWVQADGDPKPKKVETRVPLTDVFYLTFIHPETQAYVRHAISYSKKVTRLAAEDIRIFEEEMQVRPALVQKELYYVRNEAKGLWEEIKGAKNHFTHYEDVTDDYYDIWRPSAYPKDSPFEDPYKNKQRPAPVDPTQFKLDMSQRRLALMDAKERGLTTPMATFSTPGVAGLGEGQTAPIGQAGVDFRGRGAFSGGPANANQGDSLSFIPSPDKA